jgi:hypothetical protein
MYDVEDARRGCPALSVVFVLDLDWPRGQYSRSYEWSIAVSVQIQSGLHVTVGEPAPPFSSYVVRTPISVKGEYRSVDPFEQARDGFQPYTE